MFTHFRAYLQFSLIIKLRTYFNIGEKLHKSPLNNKHCSFQLYNDLCQVYANNTVVDLALSSYLGIFRKPKSIYSKKRTRLQDPTYTLNIDFMVFESYSAELHSLLSHKALGFITTWVGCPAPTQLLSDQNFSSQLICFSFQQ